jgi:hypothetical protein
VGQLVEGSVVLISHDDGRTWTNRDLPGASSLSTIDCASESFCLAAGLHDFTPVLFSTHDGGVTWNKLPIAGATQTEYASVHCRDNVTCWVSDVGKDAYSVLYRTDNSGRTWSNDSPTNVGLNPSVGCSKPPTQCWATVRGWLFRTTAAKGWAQVPIPPNLFFLSEIACIDTRNCVIVGGGQAIATKDGGSRWQRTTLPSRIFLNATACGQVCVAVGEYDDDRAAAVVVLDP